MANVSVISNGGQPMSPQLSADVGDSASPAFSETHAEDRPQQTSPPPSRVKRLSNVVEKTVDKLNRSLVTRSPCPTGNAPQGTPPRRIFSVTRKGKGRQTSLDGRASPPLTNSWSPFMSSHLPSSPPPRPLPTTSLSSSTIVPHDDSPFIRPPSPQTSKQNPIIPFRGTGTIRPGTQTLIQALQAIPWLDLDNDDDTPQSPHNIDEEKKHKSYERLTSSIHTIYRPVVRSRRLVQSTRSLSPIGHLPLQLPQHQESDELGMSDEDAEGEDFEEDGALKSEDVDIPALSQEPVSPLLHADMPSFILNRTGSMATVRLERRTHLAEKLREVFQLGGIEEVVAEMPCWLLRSILLQGYMYLTNSYICFFAHMPSKEDRALKTGSLSKKAQRTKRWIKHWFVLKGDALSWYQSSSDPYFPHGIVDLRYAISCEAIQDKEFCVRTNNKTVLLSADSGKSRDEWVKAVKKVIFKAQNSGDSVKIAIPYSAVISVDKCTAMEFSETIEIKVMNNEEKKEVDSYFFAYFQNLPTALAQLQEVVKNYRAREVPSTPQLVLDTTTSRVSTGTASRSSGLQDTSAPKSSMTPVFRLSSLLRPLSGGLPSSPRSVTSETVEQVPNDSDAFTHIRKRNSSFIPFSSPRHVEPNPPAVDSRCDPKSPSLANPDHTYPPSTLHSLSNPNQLSLSREATSWASTVPSWLKGTRNLVTNSLGFNALSSTPTGVREMYSSIIAHPPPLPSKFGGDLAYSMLETPNIPIPDEEVQKFRTAFAFDGKEELLGYFPGYIYRLLPVFGRMYISTNFFCFKSSGPLTVRTRMTLPIKDILATEKSKAWHFGRYGLIVIIKGHEELFFEFNDEEKRDAFMVLLETHLEIMRHRPALDHRTTSPEKREALLLSELEPRRSVVSSPSDSATSPIPTTVGNLPLADSLSDSIPAVMFTSASSTFLTFKPSKSLNFTLLTIGSRGDVQPYIALAKGLMADGHKVKIATHGDFKEWIESHGIEFGYVGGDPAELMRICVENGTFTVAFLKEGLQKFRGWVDDLLKTSWEACQDSDVLIESPSAMGGYHIAEALGIPYFRAFTMTWTRTRAYPNAFAVPERKMGGSYNYMSYVMVDQVFWRATAGQINRWRRNTLRLPHTSLDKMEIHKIPFLYNFSASVVPPPLDWPEWIRVTGYWFLNDADVSAKKWAPPPDLTAFLDNSRKLGKKVVYIGFGSIVVSDPKALTRTVIDAVMESGVHAILSKGWSDKLHIKTGEAAEPEEPLPPQIYAISAIPHDWLFQRIDAACHHGGSGTTGASLRAGIPTIIRPFFGDQFFWADRVEALGVGSSVRKLTVSGLADALRTATTDIKQIDRAKLIGEQIRQENGVENAIESIYRDLEYARSLIRSKHSTPGGGLDDSYDFDYEDNDDDTGNYSDIDQSTILQNFQPNQPAQPARTHRHRRSQSNPSGYSSSGSGRGAPSEDWSLVSDPEDSVRRSSVLSRPGEGRRASKSRERKREAAILVGTSGSGVTGGVNVTGAGKRTVNLIAATVRSGIDALTSTSPKSPKTGTRRRSLSVTSDNSR